MSSEELTNKYIEILDSMSDIKDKHFDKELTLGYEKFKQRFFEAYICKFLKEYSTVKSDEKGPDFIVDDNINIECIVPTNGDKNSKDKVPEKFLSKENDVVVNPLPEEKLIPRLSSAFYDKYKKYQEYKSQDILGNRINIIAIKDSITQYSGLEDNIPRIVKSSICNWISKNRHN